MDGLTPAREMPAAGSQLCSLLKALVQQGLGAGLGFRLPLAPRLERKTKHSREKMSIGDPRDVLICALNIGLEKGFPSAQGLGCPGRDSSFSLW